MLFKILLKNVVLYSISSIFGLCCFLVAATLAVRLSRRFHFLQTFHCVKTIPDHRGLSKALTITDLLHWLVL